MLRKPILMLVALMSFSPLLFAQEINLDNLSKITLEQTEQAHELANHPFKQTVMQNLVNKVSEKLDQNKNIVLFNQVKEWESLSGDAKGTHLIRFSIKAKQFTKGKIKVNGAQHASLFLNASQISGNKEFALELLNQDYRALLLVSGLTQWQDFSIDWNDENDLQSESSKLVFSNDRDKKRASMKHYYDSETVGTLNLSPNGKWLVWSKRQYSDLGGDKVQQTVEIIDIDTQDLVYRWQAMNPDHLRWRDDSKALVFMHANSLYQLDMQSKILSELASNLKDVRSVDWLSEHELILSWHQAEDKPHPFTKRYRALQDRWSYWRGNLQLHKFDLQSGLFQQITANSLSTNLQDIDTKNRKALVTRSPVDYKQPPHGLTQLFELDLDSSEEKALGEYRTFNSAQYHDKGILITAGPSFADDTGVNLRKEPVPNDYDGQLYLMTNAGEISALSKDFMPAIGQAQVLDNGDILLLVTDQDRRQLFRYDFSDKDFLQVNTNLDVVSGFSVSSGKRPILVYKGTSATRPQSVFATKVPAKKQTLLFDSAKQDFANIDFIKLKDWDYTSESGQLIDGRVYYPANFDETQSYPAIIYYYDSYDLSDCLCIYHYAHCYYFSMIAS